MLSEHPEVEESLELHREALNLMTSEKRVIVYVSGREVHLYRNPNSPGNFNLEYGLETPQSDGFAAFINGQSLTVSVTAKGNKDHYPSAEFILGEVLGMPEFREYIDHAKSNIQNTRIARAQIASNQSFRRALKKLSA